MVEKHYFRDHLDRNGCFTEAFICYRHVGNLCIEFLARLCEAKESLFGLGLFSDSAQAGETPLSAEYLFLLLNSFNHTGQI